jgi:hypothetical protein
MSRKRADRVKRTMQAWRALVEPEILKKIGTESARQGTNLLSSREIQRIIQARAKRTQSGKA